MLLARWEASPPAAQEAAWQSRVLEEGLEYLGSTGQCSLLVITESLEYFNNQNAHPGVFWLKISSTRQDSEHNGCLGTGEVVANVGYQEGAWGVV